MESKERIDGLKLIKAVSTILNMGVKIKSGSVVAATLDSSYDYVVWYDRDFFRLVAYKNGFMITVVGRLGEKITIESVDVAACRD